MKIKNGKSNFIGLITNNLSEDKSYLISKGYRGYEYGYEYSYADEYIKKDNKNSKDSNNDEKIMKI